MRLALFGLVMLACSSDRPPEEPANLPLDDLLRRHAQAVGGEATPPVEALRYHLAIVEPTFQVDAEYVVNREGMMRIDVFASGRRVFTEAFDGKTAWQLGEEDVHGQVQGSDGRAALWHGTQSPLKIHGLQEMARLGHRVAYEGRETLDGVSYHRVRVTLSDGWENLYYLDPETYLIARNRDERALHPDIDAAKRRLEDRQDDYRPIGGALKPFRSVQVDLDSGEVLQTTTIAAIEVNPPLDPGLFRMP